jgi:hypothetical protein
MQGNTVKIINETRSHKGGGKRGTVDGFSVASRSRLLRLLNTLVFKNCLFVTLTYRRNEQSKVTSTSHLNTLRYEQEKVFGLHTVVWRKEVQQRGAIHFHLLIFDPSDFMMTDYVPWVSQMWNEIAQQADGDEYHLLYGTKVDKVGRFSDTDRGALISYVCKYASKDMPTANIGRVWGCWRKSICEAERVELDIPTEKFADAWLMMRNAGAREYTNPGCDVSSLFMGKMGLSTDAVFTQTTFEDWLEKFERV